MWSISRAWGLSGGEIRTLHLPYLSLRGLLAVITARRTVRKDGGESRRGGSSQVHWTRVAGGRDIVGMLSVCLSPHLHLCATSAPKGAASEEECISMKTLSEFASVKRVASCVLIACSICLGHHEHIAPSIFPIEARAKVAFIEKTGLSLFHKYGTNRSSVIPRAVDSDGARWSVLDVKPRDSTSWVMGGH